MDAEDESLFVEWENDAIFNNFPDCTFLNSYHDNLESGESNKVSSEKNNCYVQMDIDRDYALAMSLQEEFDDEIKENANTNSKQNNCYVQTDIDLDSALAMSLQKEFNDEVKESTNTNSKNSEASKPLSIVDEQWELIDPHPDIHALFVEFDKRFFYEKLKSVEVRWSPRMTLCAGICSYQGKGGLCSIGLSAPLLKLRPRRDLVETLLHEMIHAYLFVTANNKDRDGHGPEFLSHMRRINRDAGTSITVYHSFHAEVNLYKQHWWKCDGPCRNRSPYFGLVKRAMNRAPGPKDNWWSTHQLSCGGKFIKIKEPSNFSEKNNPKRKLQSDPKTKSPDIRKFIKSNNREVTIKGSSQLGVLDIESSAVCIQKTSSPEKDSLGVINATDMPKKENFIPFQGTGHKLGVSARASQVSSNFPSINLKDLHVESRTYSPPNLSRNTKGKEILISPRKSLIKKVVPFSSIGKTPCKRDLPSCSSQKASTKKNVHSSSTRKIITIDELYSSSLKKVPSEKDKPSSLSGKCVTAIPPSRSAQISRMSNANEAHGVQSGLDFCSEVSSNKTNRLEKSVVENSLSLTQNKSDYLQESCVTGVNFSSGSTKLYCPVCSNLVNEEINVHLDKCLKTSTVL